MFLKRAGLVLLLVLEIVVIGAGLLLLAERRGASHFIMGLIPFLTGATIAGTIWISLITKSPDYWVLVRAVATYFLAIIMGGASGLAMGYLIANIFVAGLDWLLPTGLIVGALIGVFFGLVALVTLI